MTNLYIMNLSSSFLFRRVPCKMLNTYCRYFSSQNKSLTTVFDKEIRVKHLNRSSTNEEAHLYDYIKEHVALDICDRIEDLKSDDKRIVFNLGSCSGFIIKNLNPNNVYSFTQGDISKESLLRCRRVQEQSLRFPIDYVECDEEYLPLKSNSFDLVISCLNLHWVNDLVSCFKQIHDSLKPNSPFIGTIFGGDTIHELRSSLQLAELERLSGFSAHVAPKTTGQDIARLLQGSGFKLITVDISELKIHYPSIYELMFDLQGMGENNASLLGSRHMHRDVLQAAGSIYQYLYGVKDNIDKGIPATFQMIHFIGWKDPTKATPLRNE